MVTKPVISAVGHEIDFTIADFVADIRASTPSAAAEMVVAKEEEFRNKIDQLAARLGQAEKYLLEIKRNKVNLLAEEYIYRNFQVKLMTLAQRVDDLKTRSVRSMLEEKRQISESRARAEAQAEKLKHLIELKMKGYEAGWERLASALSNLSPLNILKKGYTICWKAGGLLPVVKATEVEPGDDLIVSFYRGEINCQVKGRDPRIKIESRFIKESK